jgi:hypothetical protein
MRCRITARGNQGRLGWPPEAAPAEGRPKGAAAPHVALQLGQDPALLFDEAAAYAGPARELLQAFGHRQDVTVEAFGWREVATEHGPKFVPA